MQFGARRWQNNHSLTQQMCEEECWLWECVERGTRRPRLHASAFAHPSDGDAGNCPLCLYLKFTVWLPPNISGSDLLTIHDFNYILKNPKNKKIYPQSLVSSAVLSTYFCVIVETIRFKIACPAAIGTEAYTHKLNKFLSFKGVTMWQKGDT